MAQWLAEMTSLQRIFAYIALGGTMALLIQFALLLFGLGGETDADAPDLDADDFDAFDGIDVADFDADDFDPSDMHTDNCPPDCGHVQDIPDGLRPFTLRGLIAFVTLFGWVGLLLLKIKLPWIIAALGGAGAGLFAMVLLALAFRAMYGLQSDGNIDPQNACGRIATVYLTIPPNRKSGGKVNITIQERFLEISAITDADRAIKTGEQVVVIGAEDDVLLVLPTTDGES